MAAPRVAVVGAGLAGLTAALELQDQGFEVALFERSRLVGGKATSFGAGGTEVDSGQHVFLGCFDAWLELVRRLRMEEAVFLQPDFEVTMLDRERGAVHLKAARLPAPLHLLPALLHHRLLGLAGRFQVARALVAARRDGPDDESFASWLVRHGQGPEAMRSFWEPFFVPALNAPLAEASAADGRFVIRTAFLGRRDAVRIGWTRVPLGRVAETAARQVREVYLRSPVTSLRFEGGLLVAIGVGGEFLPFDGAVLAVPPTQLSRLLDGPDQLGVAGLEGIRAQPIVDVHLWYSAAGLGFEFAALIDSPVQWVFEKSPGHVCCSLSAAGRLVLWPEQELAQLCHRELEAVLPQLRGLTPYRHLATRDPQATYATLPGAPRPGPVTGAANLVLAGAWTDTGWPATMESAVRSGRTAARKLSRELSGRNVSEMVA